MSLSLSLKFYVLYYLLLLNFSIDSENCSILTKTTWNRYFSFDRVKKKAQIIYHVVLSFAQNLYQHLR